MPRGDRTGPEGMGSMTGRAAGYCAGHGMPGYANPVPGRGAGRGFGMRGGFGGRGGGFWGRGFGGGRGWRHGFGVAPWPEAAAPAAFSPQPGPEAEKQWLSRQAEYLQSELDAVKQRLDEMEDRPGAE